MDQQQPNTTRNRGGRPRLPESEKRIVRITTQCSIVEAEAVAEAAERAGLTVAEWLRAAGMGHHIKTVPAINRVAYAELARLASNLNQLAARANSTGAMDAERVVATTAQAYNIVQQLRAELLGKGAA